MKKLLKFVRDVILGLVLSPLNAVFIIIALVHIIINVLLYRYKKVMNDLRSFIPITIHKFKVWRKYRKKR